MADTQRQFLDQMQDLLEQQSFDAAKSLLGEHRSSEIGEVIELLDNNQRRLVFDLMDRHIAAEVLEKVDEATRSELFEIIGEEELTQLIDELDFDDAADLLSEMSEKDSKEVLDHLDEEDADQIKELMRYSEDSAGGIMDPVLVSVNEIDTIKEAINNIQTAELDEDFFSIFVVNKKGQFLGDVRIRDLLTRNENAPIKPLIDRDTISINVDADQEHVCNIFNKNDLIVVPVLDKAGVLVGRITADRVIEVAQEEAAEDMYTMAGTDAAELETVSTIRAARIRMTWLLPCLAGTAITASVILIFKDIFFRADLGAVYYLAIAFSPMIAAISGNTGLQTSAIVVQGLATGDLAALKIGQVFAREVRIAFFVAICCGFIGAMICGVLPQIIDLSEHGAVDFPDRLKIVAAFALSMFTAIMVSTTLGLLLPFSFRRIGIDPAISSGPLVTTANDSISVLIFLTLTLALVQQIVAS
jgi:magnesium transporter